MVYNAETGRNGVAHPTANDNGHGRAIEDFANVVLHGATPKATAADSLGELRTALAIYKSAETKQWEKVQILQNIFNCSQKSRFAVFAMR